MALQLAHYLKENANSASSLQVKQANLDKVLSQVGDRPVSIISICGPANLGKSFLLNYIIRCLEAKEKSIEDWIDKKNSRKPLTGFPWQMRAVCSSQSDIVTKGIWIWGKPFILKDSRGIEFAVLILDTQGIYETFTSQNDDLSVIGLCLLLSSVTILNLSFESIDNALSSLKLFCQYGHYFGEETGFRAFEKLSVLIRDFNESDKYPVGSVGGRKFLKDRLKYYHNRSNDEVEKKIRNYFLDIDCSLLPDRGGNVKGASYNGAYSLMSKLFRGVMEEFIDDLVDNNLREKKIMGKIMKAKDFTCFFNGCVEVFTKNTAEMCILLSPILTMLIECNEKVLVNEALRRYQIPFENFTKNGLKYMTENLFESAHEDGKRKAMNFYKAATKSSQLSTEKSLELRISKERRLLKLKNDEKRLRAWADAEIAAIDYFRVQFTEQFGDLTCHSILLRRLGGTVKGKAFTEFLNRLCGGESEAEIQYLWHSLQTQFDDILNSFVVESSAEERRLKAEREAEEEAVYFSCPICFEVPKCKIFQCKNGHVICEKCCNSVHECPQCRVSLVGEGKIRNRAVEEMLEKLKLLS